MKYNFFKGNKTLSSLSFGIATIFILTVFIATLNSCNKESEQITPEKLSAENESPLERIKAFQSVIDDVNAGKITSRSDKSFTKKDLIWNIEANLNYNYANASLKFNDFEQFTDTIFVSNLSRRLDARAAVKAYNNVLGVMSNNFRNSRLQNKKIKLVDIYPIEEQNAVGVTVIMGSRTDVSYNTWVFEEGDDWRAISPGKCDGSKPESNAAKELEKSVNYNYPYPGAITPCIIDVQKIELRARDNDGDDSYYGWNKLNHRDYNPGDYKYDYATWRLYFCEGNKCDPAVEIVYGSEEYDYITCIDHDEMNYYSHNIEKICADIENDNPRSFCHIDISYDIYPIKPLDPESNEHLMEKGFWYADVYLATVLMEWGDKKTVK